MTPTPNGVEHQKTINMSTYTQIIYQIVFSTKNHEHTLATINRDELYRYVWGVLTKKDCHLYRIGSTTDHVHIVTHLHPSIALAPLVRDIKISSSGHIKTRQLFHRFDGWQDSYGAFTYSINERDRLIEYVKNQEQHHEIRTFKEEYIELLREHHIEFDEKYLW